MMELLGFDLTDDSYVDGLLSRYDDDGDGTVDIFEFKDLWQYIDGDKILAAERQTLHEWQELCARFDSSGEGHHTRAEVENIIKEGQLTISTSTLDQQWEKLGGAMTGHLSTEYVVQLLRSGSRTEEDCTKQEGQTAHGSAQSNEIAGAAATKVEIVQTERHINAAPLPKTARASAPSELDAEHCMLHVRYIGEELETEEALHGTNDIIYIYVLLVLQLKRSCVHQQVCLRCMVALSRQV